MRNLISLCILMLGAHDRAAKEVTVCDLLRSTSRYNGEMVQVNGTISTGGGLWLSERPCDQPLIVGGHVFPDWIALADPDNRDLSLHRITFRWPEADRSELMRFLVPVGGWPDPRVMARNPHGSIRKLRGTVIGLFETRSPLSRLINRFGGPSGFGDQGEAPAQIIVKRTINLRTFE